MQQSKNDIVPLSTLRQSIEIHSTSTCYHYFIGVSETIKEPQSFNEAIKNPWWQDAMDKEMKSMESIQKNDTWDLVELLVGKKPISSKWVYKLKQGPNHVETCKARLVTRGWWAMCWDRFWRNIFSYCEMGNTTDDSSLSYPIILGIISLKCKNYFFEQRIPRKNLHDST